MAMNKTEAKHMERLETLLALRITEQVDPDVAMPSSGWVTGWSIFYDRIEQTYTNSYSQRFGSKDKMGSRTIHPIYSTRVKALRAMRNKFEIEAAQKLRRIDLEIAQAELLDAAELQPAPPAPEVQP